jgi:hypothetical protein
MRPSFIKRLMAGLSVLGALSFLPHANAEVKLDFWHSYVHQPSGVIHYSFQIASYKRGIFFGSCGLSTRSLQWEYDIDLAGAGPVYQKDNITVTSEARRIQIVSGDIRIGSKQGEATINLRVKSSGSEADFYGNGTHSIKKLN